MRRPPSWGLVMLLGVSPRHRFCPIWPLQREGAPDMSATCPWVPARPPHAPASRHGSPKQAPGVCFPGGSWPLKGLASQPSVPELAALPAAGQRGMLPLPPSLGTSPQTTGFAGRPRVPPRLAGTRSTRSCRRCAPCCPSPPRRRSGSPTSTLWPWYASGSAGLISSRQTQLLLRHRPSAWSCFPFCRGSSLCSWPTASWPTSPRTWLRSWASPRWSSLPRGTRSLTSWMGQCRRPCRRSSSSPRSSQGPKSRSSARCAHPKPSGCSTGGIGLWL